VSLTPAITARHDRPLVSALTGTSLTPVVLIVPNLGEVSYHSALLGTSVTPAITIAYRPQNRVAEVKFSDRTGRVSSSSRTARVRS
jgi:hypothetical protein